MRTSKISRILSVIAIIAFATSVATRLHADCNGNSIPDPRDVATGTSEDCNSNTIPDECEQSLFQLSRIGEPTDLKSLPDKVSAADIDGDGYLDFVLASSAGDGAKVSVYFNEVDAPDAEIGAVSAPLETPMGSELEGFALGDIDLDGDVDVVGVSQLGVEVRWNDGGAAFSEADPVPFSPEPRDVTLADFNGDGAVDVVIAHKTDEDPAQITILLNSQTPGADPVAPAPPFHPAHAIPGDGQAVAVATGDFDGDGDVDVVTADEKPRGVSIFLNEGCGESACSFAAPIMIPVQGRFRRAGIIGTAQLTSDNATDIVVAAFGEVFILLNDGDGRSFETSSLQTRTRQLNLIDVDSDSDVDIVSTGLQAVSVLLNSGGGRFDSLLEVGSGETLRELAPGDFDNDSRIDVAVVTGSGELAVFSQLGADVINFERLDVDLPFNALPHAGSLADFDGDGDLDVVTGNGHRNTLSALENVFDESPTRFKSKDLGAANAAVHAMTHGDFDNDGDVDVVAGGFDSNIRLFSNEGNWEFRLDQQLGGRCVYLSAGDLNADGWTDLICSGTTLFVYLNDGTGKLVKTPHRQRTGAGPRNAVTADFDGDGFGDLVVANATSRTVSILLHDGKGRFSGRQIPVGGAPAFVIAGDWDNDGDNDIATANVPQETFSVLLNQGGGSFGEPNIVILRSTPFTMATGDLNGNGRLDVVTTNETAETLTVLLNLGDGEFAVTGHLETGRGPRYTPVGDLDGDRIDDIVSLNRNGADARVFLNRFSATASSDFANKVCTLVDFAGLAARTRGASVTGDRLSVKFTVPARDDPTLIETVLQNTKVFPLHEQFLSTIHSESFPGLDATGLIGLTQVRATRAYYIGALERILTDQGFLFVFSVVAGAGRDEVLTVDEVDWVYKKLRGAFTLESPLYYAPDTAGENPLAREAAESWENPPFPIFDGTVDLDVEYIAYTESVGYGRVRLFSGAEFDESNESGRFTFQDIAVIDHAPRDIEGVVGGVITAAPQGALSHISVRTARRGTPNAFVDKAMLLFKPFEGQLVRLEVTEDEYIVTPATQEQAEAFWDAREGLPEPRPFDAEHRSLDHFEDIGSPGDVAPEARYGGKASGLARLQTILTGEFEQYRERGFAIPMAYYLDFMNQNVIPSAVDERDVSYQEYLNELFALESFRTDSEHRFTVLDDFRDFAEDNGVLPEGLVEAISARVEDVFGSREVMVRHRSSSNVEDILQFNGAGLYESTGVCVADSFDDDNVGPSLCDPERAPERTIERALKKVWTSLWTFRAYEERSFFKIPQESATMGILVNRSFLREKANGVAFTGDPVNPRRGCYLVTAQVGEESVVNPEPGILPEVNILEVTDGVVVNIVRSRRSTLVGEGEVVLSDEKLREFGRLMWHIDENYPVDTEGFNREDILLDMEFKLEPDDALAVKQIRPFLIAGERPERPTFELKIPRRAAACGAINVAAPSGDLMEEYESKSVVRFRAGTHTLPSGRCVFSRDLIEEVVVGSGQEVATPVGPGLFRVVERRETNGPGTVFRFKYEQEFSLPGERSFKIELFNLEFTARDGAPVERTLVLDEEYRTFHMAMLGTSEDLPFTVNYSSCDFPLLPDWKVTFDLDDGTAVRLSERFVPPDDVTKTGQAAVTSAAVTIGGEAQSMTSYWDLVYAAGRHNTSVKYWVFLDPPASIPGVNGDVHVIALWGQDRPDVADIVAKPQEAAAAYLDENFAELARPGVVSFARREISFRRGDSNLDGGVDIRDAIRTLDALFRDGTPLDCQKASDANDDGKLNVTDATWTLLHVFAGRVLPKPAERCDIDPTPDGLGCDDLSMCP